MGKPILFVSTTAGSGLKNTLDYMENLSIQWGAFPTNKIGRKITTLKKPISEKEYRNFVSHIKMEKKDFKPTLNQLMIYQVQRVMAQKLLPRDKEYWIKKRWNESIYFYDCKINVFKKSVAVLFHKMLYNKMKKVDED